MINRAADSPSVILSVGLYRLLLKAYPKSFQQEYGPHMLQVFRDLCRRSHGRRGPSGMLSLWALTLLDLVRSLVEEHLQRETLMSKNTLIRLGGWAMVIGGAATMVGFVSFLTLAWLGWPTVRSRALEAAILTTMAYGPVAVAVGLFALRARFGEAVGTLGSSALLLGAVGGTALLAVASITENPPTADGGFGFTGFGLMLTYVTLALYGVLALQRKPQPQWNGLAALSSLAFLLLLATATVTGFVGNGEFTTIVYLIESVLVAVMGGALVLLGYQVQSGLVPSMSIEPSSA